MIIILLNCIVEFNQNLLNDNKIKFYMRKIRSFGSPKKKFKFFVKTRRTIRSTISQNKNQVDMLTHLFYKFYHFKGFFPFKEKIFTHNFVFQKHMSKQLHDFFMIFILVCICLWDKKSLFSSQFDECIKKFFNLLRLKRDQSMSFSTIAENETSIAPQSILPRARPF